MWPGLLLLLQSCTASLKSQQKIYNLLTESLKHHFSASVYNFKNSSINFRTSVFWKVCKSCDYTWHQVWHITAVFRRGYNNISFCYNISYNLLHILKIVQDSWKSLAPRRDHICNYDVTIKIRRFSPTLTQNYKLRATGSYPITTLRAENKSIQTYKLISLLSLVL